MGSENSFCACYDNDNEKMFGEYSGFRRPFKDSKASKTSEFNQDKRLFGSGLNSLSKRPT